MLLRFYVENFRSIRDGAELFFRTPDEDKTGRQPGTSVAAIFGANASGKSNFLKALQDVRGEVLFSFTRRQPSSAIDHTPFALDPSSADRDTTYELDFMVDGVRYQYGYSFNAHAIRQEWLYSFPEVRRRTLFEREEGEFRFGRGLRGPNKAVADLTRPNSLYLSTAASNNHEGLTSIFHWFETIAVSSPDNAGTPRVTTAMLADEARSEIERFLTFADLGITGVTTHTEEMEPEIAKALKELVNTIWVTTQGDDAEEPEVDPTQTRIELEHRSSTGAVVRIPLADESRGTQVWFSHLGPMVRALREGSLLVIDELDASLHPRLSNEIVRLFAHPETNPHGAQLIFTTHDTSLLSSLGGESLAREEIWFTDKDRDGATTLYPLSDFRPRKNEAFERGYLQGRYGAIPIVNFAELADAIVGSE
jgi:uncharacterized protein